MNAKTEYKQCSHELIGGLIEIVRMAVIDQFPSPRLDVADVSALLDAMHVLRPTLTELNLFDGFVHVVRGEWHDAIALFSTLVSQDRCMPGSRAMLVYCLSASGNSDWKIEAEQLLHQDKLTPEARSLVYAVIARNDMEKAREDAYATGEFNEPESLKRLRDDYASYPIHQRESRTRHDVLGPHSASGAPQETGMQPMETITNSDYSQYLRL
ncbi:hypothetical protein WM40_15650 [Robbsia andropogonis]|uniref:Type III secretion protein n=1 Tax=Robbsia andropogonis TaxID=28092 RepID=A0A0F5JY15_9BURK|nr:HrpB1 family type III secretion system apparatus protein [Robbsia andropogonis]KKB62728.1 hypothetical protein WM40_15650 [Robbsia andropogonis]MCP1119708.1 HrpB1 family type III secretion system apparatus protein [Robbsia andropogonis]MCP1129691.1 HrpB1 family type III secretion system apparatus protein [Robbsia andropogonis]